MAQSKLNNICAVLFLLLLNGSAVSSRKCTFEDEAMVVHCSAPLISEHLVYDAVDQTGNSTEVEADHLNHFAMDFAHVGRICSAFDTASKCLEGRVSRKCRMKALPNLIPLWEYLCREDDGKYMKMVVDESSCYRAIGKDAGVVRCLKASNHSLLNLGQIRQGGGREGFCRGVQAHLDCYKEFSLLEKCQQAVNLERQFYQFIMQNYTSTTTSETDQQEEQCNLAEMEELMKDYRVRQKERAIGGCDESGVCKCIDGYVIHNESRKCVDVDECAEGTHNCSQRCTNTEGNYTCQCDPHLYSLSPANNRTCVRKKGNGSSVAPVWLLFAHGQSIWNVSDDGKFVELKLAGLEKTAMLDVDVETNTIYFVDNGKGVIQRMNVANGSASKPELVQNYEVDGVEGIAVDYVGRNLYSARKTDIFVQSMDGKYRMRLYKNKLATPRALVLYAKMGMLYGSDWSSSPFIYKAATDGTHFEKIVTKDIVWPNGLAVDTYAERIYWADAFLDTIQSMDLNGAHRRTILVNSGALAHLFGLAVADDFIYWTDWTHRGILRANKLTGQNVTLLAQTTLLPYGIKVFHSLAQPGMENGRNPCSTKNCSHMCLLSKSGSEGMCVCSDGYSLSPKDGKSCKPDCKESSKNIIVCGGSEPKCVNKRYVCDGILHCPDRLDELNCPERNCPLGQFQCLDDPKNCLLEPSAICDGVKQCKDGSDDRFCGQKKT